MVTLSANDGHHVPIVEIHETDEETTARSLDHRRLQRKCHVMCRPVSRYVQTSNCVWPTAHQSPAATDPRHIKIFHRREFLISDVARQGDHNLLVAKFSILRFTGCRFAITELTTSKSTASRIAASNQAVEANVLYVTSVEHVHRHILSLTFQNASIMLLMRSSAVLCFLARLRSKTRDLHTLFSVHKLSESVQSFIHASTNQTFKCPCSTVGFLATPAVSVLSSRNIVNLYTSSARWEKHLAF